jgi:RNA polymerase subunit RPABC4/transcription elongation factor Spt4
MTEYPQRADSSWNQQMRLIRFRRKKESFSLRQEFQVVPRWLKRTLLVLFILAQVIAIVVQLGLLSTGEAPPDLQRHPPLTMLAVAGMITITWLSLSAYACLIAYVNRDAKRREMSAGLWTLLVIVLSPAYFAIGFIIYFLLREPLPYNCPQCSATVGARFNFCPNCKCNLHPACPQCKREVSETDKFCPYCAQELAASVPGDHSTVAPSE